MQESKTLNYLFGTYLMIFFGNHIRITLKFHQEYFYIQDSTQSFHDSVHYRGSPIILESLEIWHKTFQESHPGKIRQFDSSFIFESLNKVTIMCFHLSS